MVQPFGVCFTNTTINHTQVVVPTSASGPNGIDSTATCPTGTRLLGGGAQVTLASNQRVEVAASFPSDSTGKAASDASTNTTTAYAICSGNNINVSGITVTVKHTHVAGPTSPSSTATATTAACGAGEGNLIRLGSFVARAVCHVRPVHPRPIHPRQPAGRRPRACRGQLP